MRCFAFWLALVLQLCAQVQDDSQGPIRTYHLLRENDDWSFLADPATRATSVLAAKSAKHSNRSETTTGENSATRFSPPAVYAARGLASRGKCSRLRPAQERIGGLSRG